MNLSSSTSSSSHMFDRDGTMPDWPHINNNYGRGEIERYIFRDGLYRVMHMWIPTIGFGLHLGHHSHIQIIPLNAVTNNAVLTIGMFSGRATDLVRISTHHDMQGRYRISDSYTPNPIRVWGDEICTAFRIAEWNCNTYYHLLRNNCQKFARTFMNHLPGVQHR